MTEFIELDQFDEISAGTSSLGCKASGQSNAELLSSIAIHLAEPLYVGGSHFIRLPILYPSNTRALVMVRPEMGRMVISDNGSGFAEAERYGAGRSYATKAKAMSEEYGIQFDGRSFWTLASTSRSCGAIASIGSVSVRTLWSVVDGMTSEKDNALRIMFRSKIIEAFGEDNVAEKAIIRGGSKERYTIDFMAQSERGKFVFHTVAKHHSSFGAAVIMFRDLALLEKPPAMAAAIKSKEQFGPKLVVLESVANVVDGDSAAPDFRNLAVMAA